MTTPTFTLPTSGSDPRKATKDDLESNINQIIEYLDYSRITGDEAETALRIAGDDAEGVARKAADDNLSARITAEEAARIAGDDAGTEGFYNAGSWDASIGRFPIARGTNEDQGTVQNGDTFRVSVAGTVDGETFAVDQRIIAQTDNPSSTTYAGEWERANSVAILAPINERVDLLQAGTVSDLRGIIGTADDGRTTLQNGNTYKWVSDVTWEESAICDEVVKPTGIVGAGRWVISVPESASPTTLTLPRLNRQIWDATADTTLKVMLFGDSLMAKYDNSPLNFTFQEWLRRRLRGASGYLYSDIHTVTGGTVGPNLSMDDDSTVSANGYHYDLGVGTYRFRRGGVDYQGDTARIYYAQEVGAGSFTLTMTAANTSETVSVTVDASGSRSSGVVELTLPGQVTGLNSATSQRVEVEVEVTSGTVKFLPWSELFDSTVTVPKLHYNDQINRGGFVYDPDTFAANANLLFGQIIDYQPDVILMEFADPYESTRDFLDLFIAEMRTRGLDADILLIGSPPVYDPVVNPSLSETETENGIPIDTRRLCARYMKSVADQNSDVYFYDHGTVIRSQQAGYLAGFYSGSDHIHPTASGNAALLASFVNALGTFDDVSDDKNFARVSIGGDLVFGDFNRGIDEVSGKIQSGAFSYDPVGGDFDVSFWRNFWFTSYRFGERRVFKAEHTGVIPGISATLNLGSSSAEWQRLYLSDGVYVDNKRVVKEQQSAIANASGGDEVTKINGILGVLRSHGLIAT